MNERPGYQTIEFWVTILSIILGVFLILKGKEEYGAMLIAASGVAYPIARGITKK